MSDVFRRFHCWMGIAAPPPSHPTLCLIQRCCLSSQVLSPAHLQHSISECRRTFIVVLVGVLVFCISLFQFRGGKEWDVDACTLLTVWLCAEQLLIIPVHHSSASAASCSAQGFRLVLWGAVPQSSLWPSHSGCSAALSANLCVLHGGLGWSFGVLFVERYEYF